MQRLPQCPRPDVALTTTWQNSASHRFTIRYRVTCTNSIIQNIRLIKQIGEKRHWDHRRVNKDNNAPHSHTSRETERKSNPSKNRIQETTETTTKTHESVSAQLAPRIEEWEFGTHRRRRGQTSHAPKHVEFLKKWLGIQKAEIRKRIWQRRNPSAVPQIELEKLLSERKP